MKITDIIGSGRPTLSFEVFPPKTSTNEEQIKSAVTEIAELAPDFMSVTYGAGGGTSARTAEISSIVMSKGVTALAHLSCISSSKQDIDARIAELRSKGIENVLALRGDAAPSNENHDFRYAEELIRVIRASGADFCIGGACYPECHPEAKNQDEDIANLAHKVEAGCDFLTSQMFFDNSVFYSFLWRLLSRGIDVPVIAGVMPVTNAGQIKRICALSGTTLPSRFRRIVDKFGDKPEAMKQAGIAYATEQIIDLYANGVSSVHLYTMNKPDVARAIKSNLSSIIKAQ